MQFTKLFNSILDSTIWQEPKETKIVWITMLAMVDRCGEVHASIPGLARRAGVTIPECELALACLLSPDTYSRTKDHDGVRIAEIDGGWALLNHGKYRTLLSAEERREYNRRKQAEYRSKAAANDCLNVKDSCINVKECVSNAHITDADTDTEVESEPIKETKKNKRVAFHAPSVSEVEEYGKTLSPEFTRAAAFVDFYESKGWLVGKSPMKSWQASVRTWNNKDENPSGKPSTLEKTTLFDDSYEPIQ